METIKEYFTVEEVAQLFSVNEETVRRWIRRKEKPLKAELISKKQGYRVKMEDIIAFMEKNKYGDTNTKDIATTLLKGVGRGAIIGSRLLGAANIVGFTTAGLASSIIGLPVIASAALAGVLGSNLLPKLYKQLSEKGKLDTDVLIEIFTVERSLQEEKSKMTIEISRLQSEIKLIDEQISSVRYIIDAFSQKNIKGDNQDSSDMNIT
jgi:excisionase family DNA binding protein